MESPHQYPVFFECVQLNGEQKKRIESYFQIRRKSGGGECSSVRDVDGKVYSIAFKERDAQKRVLERPTHELKFAGGALILAVRGSPEPRSPSHASLTPGQSARPNVDITTPSQKEQRSSVASSLPPHGEEWEVQLDPFLLRYLEESPQAGRKLEKELAAVCCSAQLHPREGRVLVRRLAQLDAVDSTCKSEVDKIFDGYMCHYEVDSHKVKALLQSGSSSQPADGVKLYSDIGMAVVVGERSQVNATLTDLEGSYVKHRRSLLIQRQTSVRRLGEAKLRLLWKEIELSLGRHFPEVKVTRGDTGQLILAGSAEEILKAGELITEKESLVFERTVSGKTPHFFTFLKKVYGGPRPLGDFLGVGDKVEIELRDTELHFFSLYADELDESVKKLEEKFKDVKYDVPNSSIVPPELREKLNSKTKEMNQKECRAIGVYGADSTVCLLGHAKEVEELTEMFTQFILDQSSIEGSVQLPYPELAQLLPELLQMHKFDFSEVNFSPVASSSSPTVMLEGPSSKVTEVRNRLGPFLDSIVQDRVTIDLPAAIRYFESPSGKGSLLRVAQSQKCLICFEEQPLISRQSLGVAKYSLLDGLQVLVCQGDITKQYADALVNAANEDLDHGGGVAAALSKAAGPQVQKECKAIRKQTGKIPTGEVVVTTGGNLKCKKLLHAVGPVGGRAGGREKVLLERTVQCALDLAETMEFTSIAMPCISSGIFGVPLTVCSEAIVTAVKEFGSQSGRSLKRIMLIDNREQVVGALKEACDKILGMNTRKRTPEAARGAGTGAAAGGVRVEIVQGTIETQQTDALVCPMLGHNPLSLRIGNTLANVVGPQLTAKFYKAATGATLPGDTVTVDSLPKLNCKAVIFINQVCWDNSQHGTAVQVLRDGIRKLLASCELRGFSSVALPVLGAGAVLRFPHSTACRVLLEEVGTFEQSRASGSSFLVRFVVHPSDKESSKAFQSAQEALHLRGFTNDVNPAQASFYRNVSVTNNETTAMLGGVQLQMACGDIINAGTDLIVNTTDFSTNQSGVSKAILTAAGPAVLAELAQVGSPPDLMCTTGPGLLGCKEIVHASFKADPQRIQKLCKKILSLCEDRRYGSVAFPAINTGQGAMDPVKACKAMLDGMASAISDLKPVSLSVIRIIFQQQPVFQAFRSELEGRFGQMARHRPGLREMAKQKLKKFQEKCSRTSAHSHSQGQSNLSSKPQPAVFRVISCGSDNIRNIKRDLEGILQKELIERVVGVHQFSRLDDMELDAVLGKVSVSGISLECQSGSRAGDGVRSEARDRPGSGQEAYVLKGLKEDVLSVIELINRAFQKALHEDLQDKEEAMLALNIQWMIKDENGEWQEQSLHDNYRLEEAHEKKQVSVDLTKPDGRTFKVNLTALEATDWQKGTVYKVQRMETEAGFDLPTHWEQMHDEVFRKVELQPNSPEYQDVATGFLQTAKHNIHKIERVQNVYLWHAYSVCKRRILAKNGSAELGEKLLYHGTSAESCSCIERDRFDRSYAGAHAAMFGKGVYFAVDANYSAGRYSPADASGLKRLYVARVLTGRYTVGNASMKAPPPRGSDPTDCFDSLVNNQQQPAMFVIFHDDQAYPEYLITFR
ncbi:protein mono-ADP-ribosyltransferase PARP14-like isoform 2-T2 [Odontesthes bonariensis]|uniref:protein mono-ADP-ribosyltransferase PARP14-like isoform X2 n=1 Tax=Odontesthes bonariensis TaxID=219752 RepID=UPI003F58C275